MLLFYGAVFIIRANVYLASITLMRNYSKLNWFIFIISFSLLFFAATGAEGVETLITFEGENSNDQFGISLCNAGDVNGDGYQDLLVGANLEDSGGDAAGKCYLYFGGMTPDSIPDLTFTGVEGEQFGLTVSGGGDINGDGFSDIAIHAPGPPDSSGKIYIFFGSYSMDSLPDLVLSGAPSEHHFGRAIALDGDLNNDNYDDLVAGAPESADSAGAVYLYLGGNSPDCSADLTIHGEQSGDFFGDMISTGGDVNGDGIDDMIVGAPRNDDAAILAGKAYLYLGGTPMDSLPDMQITGSSIGDAFGSAGDILSDINGDSIDEILISSPYFNNINGPDVGKIDLFLGDEMPDSIPDGTMVGELAGELFGYSVSSADIDGDGKNDIISGAPEYGDTVSQKGRVYLYRGIYPVASTPMFTDVSDDAYDGLGISVAGLEIFTRHEGDGGSFAAGGWNIDNRGAAILYGEPVSVTGSSPAEKISGHKVNIFPNPTQSELEIRCLLNSRAKISIAIYDVNGRRVASIPAGIHPEGLTTKKWNLLRGKQTKLSTGIYFVKVNIGRCYYTRKVLVIR